MASVQGVSVWGVPVQGGYVLEPLAYSIHMEIQKNRRMERRIYRMNGRQGDWQTNMVEVRPYQFTQRK